MARGWASNYDIAWLTGKRRFNEKQVREPDHANAAAEAGAAKPGEQRAGEKSRRLELQVLEPRLALAADGLDAGFGDAGRVVDGPDSLVFYDAKVWLRGEEQSLSGEYVTIVMSRPGVQATIRVSRPIDNAQKIERVEFSKQRFMFQRIRGVKTHLDLLPPNG